MNDQEQYPPEEPRGTQPHLPGRGRPANPIVGNQMGGDQQKAAHEKVESSDSAAGGEVQPEAPR